MDSPRLKGHKTKDFHKLYKQSSRNLYLEKMFIENFCNHFIHITIGEGSIKRWNKNKCTAAMKVVSILLGSQLYLKCDSIVAECIGERMCVYMMHLFHKETANAFSNANKIHI